MPEMSLNHFVFESGSERIPVMVKSRREVLFGAEELSVFIGWIHTSFSTPTCRSLIWTSTSFNIKKLFCGPVLSSCWVGSMSNYLK